MDADMAELSGALDAVGLQPLLGFLGGLHKSGTLVIEDQHWIGTLALADGQVVGARFGREQGLEALEAIFFALQHGRFQFSVSDSCEVNLAMEPSALADHLEALAREVARLAAAVPSLGAVPRVSEATGDGEVTLSRGALRLLLALDGRRPVAEHARERGLVVTLRELAELRHLGLVAAEQPVTGSSEGGEAAAAGAVAEAAVPPVADHAQTAASPTGRRVGTDLQARAAEQRRGARPDAISVPAAEPPAAATNGRRFWRRD